MDFNSFGVIGSLSQAFSKIAVFFSDLWETLYETPMRDLLEDGGVIGKLGEIVLPDSFLDSPLGWLILGAGLGFYLVYQLVTWILNVIT